MEPTELVAAVLRKALPDECEIAGPANVRDIADASFEGGLEFVDAQGSSRIDLSDVLNLLSGAAMFTATLVQLYLATRTPGSGTHGRGGGSNLPPLPPVMAAEAQEALGGEIRSRLEEALHCVMEHESLSRDYSITAEAGYERPEEPAA